MVLGAGAGDLQGPQQRGQPTGDFPVRLVHESVQQAGAIGIAASGRIHHRAGLHRRNVQPPVADPDDGALRAAGDDQRPHPRGDLRGGETGLLLEQTG
ncbi:hypothetical protein RZS08_03450, partial [Arthrospira platensis SPKY1]|nr:hypothetical protein [Arthrospira platensis SPKY1]